jgi:hypothetical protein
VGEGTPIDRHSARRTSPFNLVDHVRRDDVHVRAGGEQLLQLRGGHRAASDEKHVRQIQEERKKHCE